MSTINANHKKVPLILRVVPFYVLSAALLLSLHLLFPEKIPALSQTAYLSASSSVVTHTATARHIISGQPSRITVDRLGIDLVVNNGYYDQKTKDWTLSDNAAYYATMTTTPNNSHGSTFLYGHNTSKVFSPLKDITAGDVVNLYTSNGHIFQYIYRSDAVVTPDITSALYENPSHPQLTIMTCEGIWSKVRRMMYFDYKAVI